jgi:hypothetical protein
MEQEEKNGNPMDTWCKYTKDLLVELGLGEYWVSERLGPKEDWFALIKARIHDREEKDWRAEMRQKSKLRTYRMLKNRLEREQYLEIGNKREVTEMVRLRGGTNSLRIETGRYEMLPPEKRLCLYCDARRTEDELHFVLQCKRYEDLREEMWNEIEQSLNIQRENQTSDEALCLILGDRLHGYEEKQMKKIAMKYICRSIKRRGELEPEDCTL